MHHYILTQKQKLALRLKIDGVGGFFSLEKTTSMRGHIVKKKKKMQSKNCPTQK